MSDEPSDADPQVMADLYMVGIENAIRGLQSMDERLLDADYIDNMSVNLEFLASRIRALKAIFGRANVEAAARLQ